MKPETVLGRWQVYLLWFAHLSALLIISLIVFSNHETYLFRGLDGQHLRIFVAQQAKWMGPSIALSMDMIRGMGNAFWPVNTTIIPLCALPTILADGKMIAPLFVYTILAVEVFLATAVLARMVGWELSAMLLAGWMFVIVFLPFVVLAPPSTPFF